MRMDDRSLRVLPPILRDKHYDLASAFTPESLLREARRQKDVPNTPVPEICVLDPDGDIVRHLRAAGSSRPVAGWACYHSMMDCFGHGDREYGIVGCAVGTSYAVLVAEQPICLRLPPFSASPRQARSPPWVRHPTSS